MGCGRICWFCCCCMLSGNDGPTPLLPATPDPVPRLDVTPALPTAVTLGVTDGLKLNALCCNPRFRTPAHK